MNKIHKSIGSSLLDDLKNGKRKDTSVIILRRIYIIYYIIRCAALRYGPRSPNTSSAADGARVFIIVVGVIIIFIFFVRSRRPAPPRPTIAHTAPPHRGPTSAPRLSTAGCRACARTRERRTFATRTNGGGRAVAAAAVPNPFRGAHTRARRQRQCQ